MTPVRDVVVVGAGPAGSVTALLLARAGRDVEIVERTAFPRRKVCGEYLGPGTVAALRAIGLHDAVAAQARAIERVVVHAGGGPPLTLPLSRPGLALPRAVLDDLLLRAALAAGATLTLAHAEDVAIDDAGRACGLRTRSAGGELAEVRARFVAGADGAGSLVARKLGLARVPRGRAKFAIGGHYRGFGDLGASVEMYVGEGAYFALNPLGTDLANVMVVVPQRRLATWSHALDEHISGAAARLAGGRRSFAGTQREGARAAVGPMVHEVSSPVAGGALLVGDAAGLLDPFTGQGVFLAISGAIAAAQTLARALGGGDERALLAAYARERAADLRARRRLGAIVRGVLSVSWLAGRAARRLRQYPRAAAIFADALSGMANPRAALAPAVLGRLLL